MVEAYFWIINNLLYFYTLCLLYIVFLFLISVVFVRMIL